MRLSDLDLGDADRGCRLAVAAMAAVVLPTLELHDRDLPSASLADDLAGDPGALERLGVRDDVAVARDEHLSDHRATPRVNCKRVRHRHATRASEPPPFERGLCPRNPPGEVSEGVVE